MLNPQVPPLTGTRSDADNNGVVLRLSLGEVSFLLTADIMLGAELELISRRAVSPQIFWRMKCLKVLRSKDGDSSVMSLLILTHK